MATPLALVWDLLANDAASPAFDRAGASAIRNAKRIDLMTASTDKAAASAGGSVSKFGVMTKALGALAAVDIGVHLVHMAADFEYQMNRMVTAAGESQKNLKTVSDGVLNLMGQTGTGAKDLEAGLYQIESAGYHGAAGLNVLKVAAQGAKIENASVAHVAEAVTTAMVDYHVASTDAAAVMNTLIASVAHGKTTLDQMAVAFSNVGAAGASAHIPMADLTAAIATMTMHGTDAAKAGTYLRQVIGQIEGPSTKARMAMAGLDLDANTLAQTLSSGPGGLGKAIGMIDDAITKKLTPSGLVAVDMFKKSSGSLTDFQRVLGDIPPSLISTFGALSTMVGGVKSLQGFLQLGGENLKTYKATLDAVNKSVEEGGNKVEGWASTQRQLSVQLDMLRHGLEALGIRIGEGLVPVVQDLIQAGKNLWDIIRPLAVEVGGAFVDAWNVALTVLHSVGTALHAVGGFAKANQGILLDLGKMAAATFLAFKGITVAVAGFKALQTAIILTRVRLLELRETFAAVAAGEAAMSAGMAAIGFAAFMVAAYAASKALATYLDKGSGAAYVLDNLANVQKSFTAAVNESNGALDQANQKAIGQAAQQSGLADAANKAGISLRELIHGIGAGTDATDALMKKWQAAGGISDDNKVKLLSLAATYVPLAQKARDLAAATSTVSKATKDASGPAQALSEYQRNLTIAQGELKTHMDGTTVAIKGQTSAADLLNTALDKLSGKAITAMQAELNLKDSIASGPSGSGGSGVGAGVLTGATGSVEAATNRHARALEALRIAEEKYQAAVAKGKPLAIQQADLAVKRAQDAVAASANAMTAAQQRLAGVQGRVAKANESVTSSLNTNTDAGRKNVEWLLNLIQQANAHADAVMKQTNNVDLSIAALRNDEAQIRSAAAAHGIYGKALDDLLKKTEAKPGDLMRELRRQVDQVTTVALTLKGKLDNLTKQRTAKVVLDDKTGLAAAIIQRRIDDLTQPRTIPVTLKLDPAASALNLRNGLNKLAGMVDNGTSSTTGNVTVHQHFNSVVPKSPAVSGPAAIRHAAAGLGRK